MNAVLILIGSAIVLVLASIKMAEYSDVIAIRTGLGRMFIGAILLSGATSLPEFLTTISAIRQNVIDISAGNMFGSSMFNMFMLAILDMLFHQKRVLRQTAMRHALTGILSVMLTALATFFILAQIDAQAGWIGVDSLILIFMYGVGVYLIQQNNQRHESHISEDIDESILKLKPALYRFGITAGIVVLVTPLMVSSSSEIAEMTGISQGFIGTLLVAFITSLPEVATSIAAVRLGAPDLAIGNLFGSNMFNMFALGMADVFYLPGRFLGAISPGFVLAALIAMIITLFGLIGNVARIERKFLFIEIDASIIAIVYIVGMWFLYSRGIGN